MSALATPRNLHNRAMRATDRALEARRCGAIVTEHAQILKALRLEMRAGGLAAERRASVHTLAVLANSAHALSQRLVELQDGPPTSAGSRP